MFTVVTTTIKTTINIDTFEPEHEVSIETDGVLPTQVIYAAVEGACKATLKTVTERQGRPATPTPITADEEG